MKNTVFITFSGGCYSGKTTALENAYTHLLDNNIKSAKLSEVVRSKNIPSIDELRKDSNRYLNFQYEVINEKIEAELRAFRKNEEVVMLIDRAITDSLFYFLFYTDKSMLADKNFQKFEALYKMIDTYCTFAFEEVYDDIMFFKPIETHCCDNVFRPSKINITKHTESKAILTLNRAYGDIINVFDMNKIPARVCLDHIIHIINECRKNF